MKGKKMWFDKKLKEKKTDLGGKISIRAKGRKKEARKAQKL